jgi:hypothetical protein
MLLFRVSLDAQHLIVVGVCHLSSFRFMVVGGRIQLRREERFAVGVM